MEYVFVDGYKESCIVLRKIVKWVDTKEPQPIVWGLPLGIRLLVIYLVVQLTALLLVVSAADEDFSNPSSSVVLISGLVACVFMVSQVWQYVDNARWKVADSKNQKHPATTVIQLLSLHESLHIPIWILWLAAFALAIIIDNVALLLGKPITSLPLGLEELNGFLELGAAILLFVGLRPFVEGLVFQGVIYPALAKRLGNNRQAILGTTLLFTLTYFVLTLGDEIDWGVFHWGLLYPFSMGFLLTTMRAYSKSTLAILGAQAMFGVFLILKMLLVT